MFNRTVLNPAFSGYHEATNYTFAGRTQWVGIQGAPRTVSLSFSKPVPALRGGISAYVLGDQIGPISTTEAKVGYAFRLPVGNDGAAFQIGINGGIIYKSLDGSNWLPPEALQDPVLIPGNATQVSPDFGFGVALLGPEDRYWLGLSATHLLEPTLSSLTRSGAPEGQSQLVRLLGLQGGYTFRMSRDVDLVPSAYVRLAGGQFQADMNLAIQAYPIYAGVGYRLEDAVSGLLGLQASSKLFVAYAYDYPLSGLGVRTSGSHEIVVSYTLPRFFRFSAPTLTPYDRGRFR